jgi:hypothetical protein
VRYRGGNGAERQGSAGLGGFGRSSRGLDHETHGRARKARKGLAPTLGAKEQRLTEILEHAAGLADRYSDTIFACARVGGPVQVHANKDRLAHFEGRTFAEMAGVYVCGRPLSHDDFSDPVRTKKQVNIMVGDRHEATV